MNVVVEQLPNCLATLKVEVEQEKVSATRQAVVQELGQYARIPGYRPGKAPRATIEKRYKKEIRQELERKLVQETAREAIKAQNLRVLQIASVDELNIPETEGPVSFTATLVTQPEFELPEYKGLAIEAPSAEVTDKDIDDAIDALREQAADFEDVKEDRGAAMEDFIVVDYEGTIDGKPVQDEFPKAGKPLTANHDFWIKMTEEAFFPGYCAAMVGAKVGETREFDVTVPTDFPVEGMPGKVIHYKVTLKGLKAKALPELNDEFANSVIKGKTVAELREIAREEITRQKTNSSEATKRANIMKVLLEKVECELPTGLVRSRTQGIVNEIVRENAARGVDEELLRDKQQDIVGNATASAREQIKGTFVLLRIAEKESITVAREELLGRVAALAQRYQMTFEKMAKELEKRNALDQIHEELLTAKTLDFLVSNASVTTAPVAAGN